MNLYQVVFGQQSVRTLFKSLACKCFFFKWPPVAILDALTISLQNGCRRPFWMSEIHFRWHFGSFQINTKLFCIEFFYKIAAGAHFGCPKFIFDRISGHFRSIGHFGCLKFTFDSNSGHFRSIRILICF